MASQSTRFARAHGLSVVMTLVGHEWPSDRIVDGKRVGLWGPAMCYFPDGQQLISGSLDKTSRLWDLQTGREVEEARVVCEQEICAVAVSRDGRWVIGGDDGELKVCGVKKGIIQTFKCHSKWIRSIDISRDSKLLASVSRDDTTRIWSLDTGKLVAGPFKSVNWLGGVQFSYDSKKVAVISAGKGFLEVWDIEAQELVVRTGKLASPSYGVDVPMSWTTKDRMIVAAFSFDLDEDHRDGPRPVKTIYEFDALTLDTVRAPFQGHTSDIENLALSFDCALLVSSSRDNTIKFWAFESRQLLASFEVQHGPCTLSSRLKHTK